jgi:hypothetical protein
MYQLKFMGEFLPSAYSNVVDRSTEVRRYQQALGLRTRGRDRLPGDYAGPSRTRRYVELLKQPPGQPTQHDDGEHEHSPQCPLLPR